MTAMATAPQGSRVGTVLHRGLLGVGGVILSIPGVRLLLGTDAYVAGKANLTLTADLYSELRAMGSFFVAAGVALLLGAASARFRGSATMVGTVALLPQGIARLISYAVDEGQHGSYLRAGVVETVLGLGFLVLLVRHQTGRES